MFNLKMIWCQDAEGGIGYQNKLPWFNEEELKHFKKTTLNSVVIMGRKTYESIGKPLPHRINVVLSRDTSFNPKDVLVYRDSKILLRDLEHEEFGNKKCWVIGGKSIYECFLKYSDELVVSKLNQCYECDLFLNWDLDVLGFKLVKRILYSGFAVEKYQRRD